tara:strand:- start:32403 stop:32975 length:573 start_codon:yes stop_codon:yes gene_type:complete
MRAALVIATCVMALTGAAPAAAQQAPTGTTDRTAVISPILTIDSERVFRESAFGRRVAAEVEAQSAKLAAENRKIEADLENEERALTKKRAAMKPASFRVLADAFDKKVQQTRSEQAAKGRALNELLDDERDIFLKAAAPVLERLMRDSGAAVILERRSVFVSSSAVEVTDDAIVRLDETLGSGEGVVKP